jgi:hypothetical protein
MHQQPRLRQRAHQAAGTAGVVEVDVGQQHPVHRLGGDAERGERTEDARHRGVARGVDDAARPSCTITWMAASCGRP